MKVAQFIRNPLIAGTAFLATSPTWAALDAAVTSAIGQAKSDATDTGALVVGAIAAACVFGLVIYLIRKLG